MTYTEKQAKIQKKAMRFLKKHTKQEAYDFATWVLHDLEERGFCIWQSYDKDDIEIGLGRKPTKDELADMQDRLMNCFEYIRP
jgi:hypothetical protein